MIESRQAPTPSQTRSQSRSTQQARSRHHILASDRAIPCTSQADSFCRTGVANDLGDIGQDRAFARQAHFAMGDVPSSGMRLHDPGEGHRIGQYYFATFKNSGLKTCCSANRSTRGKTSLQGNRPIDARRGSRSPTPRSPLFATFFRLALSRRSQVSLPQQVSWPERVQRK
jgi:hypothetical protein